MLILTLKHNSRQLRTLFHQFLAWNSAFINSPGSTTLPIHTLTTETFCLHCYPNITKVFLIKSIALSQQFNTLF